MIMKTKLNILAYKKLLFWFFKKCQLLKAVELLNKYVLEWVKLLSIIMNFNQKDVKQNLYFIDSSKIAVCWRYISIESK